MFCCVNRSPFPKRRGIMNLSIILSPIQHFIAMIESCKMIFASKSLFDNNLPPTTHPAYFGFVQNHSKQGVSNRKESQRISDRNRAVLREKKSCYTKRAEIHNAGSRMQLPRYLPGGQPLTQSGEQQAGQPNDRPTDGAGPGR